MTIIEKMIIFHLFHLFLDVMSNPFKSCAAHWFDLDTAAQYGGESSKRDYEIELECTEDDFPEFECYCKILKFAICYKLRSLNNN